MTVETAVVSSIEPVAGATSFLGALSGGLLHAPHVVGGVIALELLITARFERAPHIIDDIVLQVPSVSVNSSCGQYKSGNGDLSAHDTWYCRV